MSKPVKPSKKYDANFGALLDESFATHSRDCPDCQRFDAEKPATASLMCLEGSVLYKRDNVTRPRSARPERDDNYATKQQIKAATRYRGE